MMLPWRHIPGDSGNWYSPRQLAQSGYGGLQVQVVALPRGIAALQIGDEMLRIEDVRVQLERGALQMECGSL